MTFRKGSASPETSQLEVFSSGPKSQARKATPGLEVVDSAPDAPEAEEHTSLTETLAPSAASGEDPVRLYLKEIGKVPLLKADEEVTIGRRIEVGQIALRRALGGIPLATARLGALVDRIRREEIPLDDVILLPEGGEPK